MKWEDVKKELLKDEETRRAYEKFDWRFEISKWWTNLIIKIKELLESNDE